MRWTLFSLIEAEELGVTTENAEASLASKNPVVTRFLGADDENGKQLGLDARFAYAIVSAVGKYGDMFERNLGASSELKIDRGLNALWNKGGLLYAPASR